MFVFFVIVNCSFKVVLLVFFKTKLLIHNLLNFKQADRHVYLFISDLGPIKGNVKIKQMLYKMIIVQLEINLKII